MLPCFKPSAEGTSNRSRRFVSQRTNCNGAETVQETLTATSNPAAALPNNGGHTTVVQVLETIDELNSASQSAPGQVSIDLNKATASFNATAEIRNELNDVIVHFPSPTFSSTTPSGGPMCSTGMSDNNNENISDNNNTNHNCNNNQTDSAVENSGSDSTKTNEVVIEMETEGSVKNDGNGAVIAIDSAVGAANEAIVNINIQSGPIDTDMASHPSDTPEQFPSGSGNDSASRETAHPASTSGTSDSLMNNMSTFSVNTTVLI